MNFLFDIGHPGQVHLFRNAISKLKKQGHKVIVTVKEIPSAIILLNNIEIEYFSLGRKFDSIFFKGLSQLRYNYNLLRIIKREKIEVGVGSSITVAHVSKLSRMKSVILDDDDPQAVKLFVRFAHPFAHVILSPAALSSLRSSKKDITYPGSHELFYLHPNYFSPNSEILGEIGLKLNERFFVLRFVAVRAYHDIGEEGLTLEQKIKIIEKIKPFGKVLITTEKEIEPELEQYKLSISPEKIHHLLYYASMFIGDSQTMTSEAAILGTPAFKCNSFAQRLSLPNLLEKKYRLCYAFLNNEFDNMLNKIDEILGIENLKEEWRSRANEFINDSIDPTAFLVWFLEHYPQSIEEIKTNPDFYQKFK